MRGGENATRRVRETGVGVAGECPGSFGGPVWAWWGFPGRVWGDLWREEWSGVLGAHGLCRASFGKAGEGLEEKVPGVRAGRARSALVPLDVEFEPLCPRPGSLQAFPFGAANPAEPLLWLGALRTSCAAVGSGKVPCASSLGLTRRGVFPVLRESTRLLAVQGPYLLQNFTNRGAGRDSPAPTGESSRRAGSSPTSFSSAAPCAQSWAAAGRPRTVATPWPPPGACCLPQSRRLWAVASRTF